MQRLPAEAAAASLGCGNPIAVAELREGERVLDLRSGGGIDVLLSARRVAPTGKAYGLGMTDEMLALALSNADKTGASNVEFLKGNIEAIPLLGNTIDVVISNCVINLSVDKPPYAPRLPRPAPRWPPRHLRRRRRRPPHARRAGRTRLPRQCVAGALTFTEYREGLEAGFVNIEITPTFEAADGMHSAIIRAVKPLAVEQVSTTALVVSADSCCGVSACCTTDEQSVDPTRTVAQAKFEAGCGCQ